MAEWMLIMLEADDSFGQSLARGLKRLILAAFVIGVVAGAAIMWLLGT